jgi:hypothetical protein
MEGRLCAVGVRDSRGAGLAACRRCQNSSSGTAAISRQSGIARPVVDRLAGGRFQRVRRPGRWARPLHARSDLGCDRQLAPRLPDLSHQGRKPGPDERGLGGLRAQDEIAPAWSTAFPDSICWKREGRGLRREVAPRHGKWSTDILEASQRPLARDEWREATRNCPDPDQRRRRPRGRFVFEKIGDLRKLPPAQWLVKDWVPEGATGIFYGKWAAGKSFIGFDLALHLAYGMPDWHGAALPGMSSMC